MLIYDTLGLKLKVKVKSQFDTPQKQKYAFDNASLKPVLTYFLDSYKLQIQLFSW